MPLSNHGCTATLLLLTVLPGCYAAVGPTVGVDLPTGRATVGLEASAATLTVAQSFALGHARLATPQPVAPRRWTSRTSLLWEPGLGVPFDATNGSAGLIAAGGTLGLRVDRNDDASTVLGFSAGGWLGVSHLLNENKNLGCKNEVSPYLGLVIGVRGSELYASPKAGIVQVPHFCFSLGDGHGQGW
ncbi:MAG: hypothetical protein ABW061_01600 [Polyangiaceae bacterium]